eukprot:12421200-Ditylum_brightwellii.AAC.1
MEEATHSGEIEMTLGFFQETSSGNFHFKAAHAGTRGVSGNFHVTRSDAPDGGAGYIALTSGNSAAGSDSES